LRTAARRMRPSRLVGWNCARWTRRVLPSCGASSNDQFTRDVRPSQASQAIRRPGSRLVMRVWLVKRAGCAGYLTRPHILYGKFLPNNPFGVSGSSVDVTSSQHRWCNKERGCLSGPAMHSRQRRFLTFNTKSSLFGSQTVLQPAAPWLLAPPAKITETLRGRFQPAFSATNNDDPHPPPRPLPLQPPGGHTQPGSLGRALSPTA
jgi:hypothetical protein